MFWHSFHFKLLWSCVSSRLLGSHKYKLEKDLTDKFNAQGIDENCTALNDRMPGLGFSPNSVQVQSK